MPIYEITNPSDHYTMESDNFLAACVACCFLGQGSYGLRPTDDGDSMPIFLLGGAEEWFKATFQMSFEEAASKATGELRSELADCFDSVVIGNRSAYCDALKLIDGEDKKREWRAAWHDRNRSSMNDIGSRAWKWAERLRVKAGES